MTAGVPPERAAFLIETHGRLTIVEQAAALGRSKGRIVQYRRMLMDAGVLPYQRRPWSAEDIDILHRDIGRVSLARIAERMGRPVEAVRERAADLGIPVKRMAAGLAGMTCEEAAAALGVSSRAVVLWQDRGYLKRPRAVGINGWRYRTVDPDDLVRFLRERGALLDCLNPTDLAWREIVAEARAELEARLIHGKELRAALYLTTSGITRLRKDHDFPAPALRLSDGTYYDRAAVRAWLDAHPQYRTRATDDLFRAA